jgi:hypothetical protein
VTDPPKLLRRRTNGTASFIIRRPANPLQICAGVRAALRRPDDLGNVAGAADVERVVVILASSRGVSSFLFRLLRSTGAFVSLVGEHIHLYKLFGLIAPARPDGHDGLVDGAADRAGFVAALLDDLTVPCSDPVPSDALARRLITRLYGQWHEALPPLDELAHTIEKIAAALPSDRLDPDRRFLQIVEQLRRSGLSINPWYYDISPDLVRAVFPDLPRPSGPPPLSTLIEEPQFVVPGQGRSATRADLRERPLLLKSSSDAYRVGELTRLFPAAKMTFVHLTRNPAASVNGLIDGWLHRGFFSHRVPPDCTLSIPGYSEQPWGKTWWKFDLPPGWQKARTLPLPLVGAFQWCSAHQAILRSLSDVDPRSVLTVAAEALLENAEQQQRALHTILTRSGVDPAVARRAQESVVMSTVSPRPARWREREEILHVVNLSDRVRALASRLGYGDRPNERWI